jgi:hypothetical protein
VAKPDTDRYQLWLTDLLDNQLGIGEAATARISFHKVDSNDVCVVQVPPAIAPVFLHPPKSSPDEFHLRVQNSTRRLGFEEYEGYRAQRWGS